MKVKVWDLPTRLVHWLLVAVFALAFLASRDEWLLEYHAAAGYAALVLVLFRVFWGFAGARYARFSDFVRGFKEVGEFLRGVVRFHPKRYLGHNPAVGWIILFILASAAAIVVTGVITYGGEENRGVWAGVFTLEAAVYARAAHVFLSYLLVFVIVLHICAALFHDFILKENIILAMFTGKKEDAESWGERVAHLKPEEEPTRTGLIVWIIISILGGLGLVFMRPEGRSDPARIEPVKIIASSGMAVELKINRVWFEECARSCHAGFHPTLLPEASWKKVMAGLEDHFGENVSLDAKTNEEISYYLVSASAERSTSEASRKILYSLKGAPPSLRITQAPYWKDKHARIPPDVYARKSVMSKGNCVACHPGAEKGSFEDRDIGIPD
ncbi:MAG: cytochrome b/b6 domain-containing protein [Deltaproteobacteria bacterium]|nr:cytochrome b/b6 domain-containing protein [Deltaproteobacteria bacterium]